MKAPSAPVAAGGEKAGAPWWVWALLAGLVCLAAITRQSLWIDETLTAAKARATDFPGWWQAMLVDKSSDLQMPLYMIYMWGFGKLFGASEWALRMANAPWFVAGATAFITVLPARRKILPALVVLSSPFAWYYLDEARPYAMQLGASLIIFAALFRLNQNEELAGTQERRWVAAFFGGLILLSGSSLLGMIWAGGACLGAAVIFSRTRLMVLGRAHWILCGLAGGALVLLAVYYLWTMKVGARASAVGATDARNLMFIGYELLGFSGLGPGRLEIRDSGLRAFYPFALLLFAYALAILQLFSRGVVEVFRRLSRRTRFGLMLALGLPVAMILGAGFVKHFRVLGRHFTPFLPVLLALLWLGFEQCRAQRMRLAKALAWLFVVLSLASGLSFRFAARHEKDDYREAARLAKAALGAGELVWWNAGREGAEYYQVPLAEAPHENKAVVWLMNPDAATLAKLPPPEVIVASKPDVFDGLGAVAEFLRQNQYVKVKTLPAFVILQRAGGGVGNSSTP